MKDRAPGNASSFVSADGIEQAEAADFGDLAERGGDLLIAGVGQALCEAGEDALLFVLARADDERKAETLTILGVEARKGRDLVRCQTVEASGGLLAGGGGGERPGEGGASDEIGVRLDQRDLPLDRRVLHHGDEFALQIVERGEWARIPRRFDDPRWPLEEMAERGDEAGTVERVDLREGEVEPSSQLSSDERARDGVVPFNQHGQVYVEQLAILNLHAAVDDAQVHVGRLAEDERGQRVVDRATGEAERVEPVADEVRRHTWREHADVVASERRRAATGRQPQRLMCGQRGWAIRDTMQQQRLPRLRQQMRAVVGGRAIYAEADTRASVPESP